MSWFVPQHYKYCMYLNGFICVVTLFCGRWEEGGGRKCADVCLCIYVKRASGWARTGAWVSECTVCVNMSVVRNSRGVLQIVVFIFMVCKNAKSSEKRDREIEMEEKQRKKMQSEFEINKFGKCRSITINLINKYSCWFLFILFFYVFFFLVVQR